MSFSGDCMPGAWQEGHPSCVRMPVWTGSRGMAGGFFPEEDSRTRSSTTAAAAMNNGNDCFISRFPYLVFFQFVPQHPFADPELFRSARLDPAGILQRFEDQAALHGIQRIVQG